MVTRSVVCLAFFVVGCRTSGPDITTQREKTLESAPLQDPSAFSTISSPEERSKALFLEASKVMRHARCVNCHPPDDSPRQGMTHELHDPPIDRGIDNHGVVGAQCTSCHQDANLELARVPGAPDWHLAPKSMVWLGRSPSQICEQLKDTSRNGGKTLPQIVEHSAHDPLVAWGWNPGHDREPAPGSQARFGALMQAWLETGAFCPRGDET